MKYFKSINQEPVQAWNDYHSNGAALKASMVEFASNFDAKALFLFRDDGHHFYGLCLNNYNERSDTHLWTKPNSQNGYTSRPRSRMAGKENTKQLAELKEKYNSLIPEGLNVSIIPFYNSIGLSWGDLIFTGMKWVEFNGVIYFGTAFALPTNVVEITGSEFYEAKELSEKDK